MLKIEKTIQLDSRLPFCVHYDWQWLLDKFQHGEFFSFMKLNHNFWEYILGDAHARSIIRAYKAEQITEDVRQIITNWEPKPDLLLAVGAQGFRGKGRMQDTFRIISAIESTLPKGFMPQYASIWKDKFLQGRLDSFINAIKPYHVRIVGLSHLGTAGADWGLADTSFLEVQQDAISHRWELLEELKSETHQNAVYLFQTGEILSAWLIYHLHGSRNCFFVDMGRALDFKPKLTVWNATSRYLAESLPSLKVS